MRAPNITFRSLIILSQICSAIFKIIVEPRDTEAVVGQPTYLNCSTSEQSIAIRWYYYALGSHESTYIYFMGTLLPEYQRRALLERDENTGAFNLVIQTVQTSDAGKYFCQEEGGKQRYTSAELIVLDEVPVCKSNVNETGLIGPNSCGIPIEEFSISCNATYHGNIPPIIKWRKYENTLGIPQINYPGYVISEIFIRSELNVNRASYFCQTTRAVANQFGCSPTLTEIKILYGLNNLSVKEMKKGDEATCVVNSNQPCTHRWILTKDEREEIISNEANVVIQSPGHYICEAECFFKGKQCLLVAGMVHMSTIENEPIPRSIAIESIFVAIGLIIMLLGVAGTAVIRYSLKQHRSRTGVHKEDSEESPLLDSTDQSLPRSEIYGMAIFKDELLICRLHSSDIEVYNSNTFKFIRLRSVAGLINATGLTTSKDGKTLFIFDLKESSQGCEIFRVDTSYHLINSWKTNNSWGPLSATFDSNVILTDFPGSKLIEYSPDGNVVRQIKLSGANIFNPRHSIKLSCDKYVVCYGRRGLSDHNVCIFTAKGDQVLMEITENDIESTFKSENSLSRVNINVPIHLAVDKQGLIYVANKYKSGVLVLDSNLKLERELVSEERRLRMHRLWLDESNDRMLISVYDRVMECRLNRNFIRCISIEPLNSK